MVSQIVTARVNDSRPLALQQKCNNRPVPGPGDEYAHISASARF